MGIQQSYQKFIVGMLLFLGITVHHVSAQQRKNVVIIYSDDQSYHTIRAWGNPEIQTPNLDLLVAEGLSFKQAHVMGGHQGAVCIPSRVMMLTGRYLNRLPQDGSTIPDSIIGLPEILRTRGYTTFHSGKWHSDKNSHDRFFRVEQISR